MKKIPITLITGFLGSGKTTLINQILRKNKDLKIALIVNEFGDVALESQFINKTTEEIVEMSNGCMCCVVRKDIISTVDMILKKKTDVDYIIVEASGLSDPVPIAQTFLMNMNDKIRLDSVLGLVDCINVEQNFENFDIAVAQIQYSDMVLLSKVGEINSSKLWEIKKVINNINQYAKIIEINEDLPLELIIDTSKFDHSSIAELEVEDHDHNHKHGPHHHDYDEDCHDEHCHHPHHPHPEDHGHSHHKDHGPHENHHPHHEKHGPHKYPHNHEEIDELFLKTDHVMNPDKFMDFIKNLPEGVFRGKGFVYFEDPRMEGKKYLIQYVGARIDGTLSEWGENEKKQTALVLIGKKFDKEKVKSDFERCSS